MLARDEKIAEDYFKYHEDRNEKYYFITEQGLRTGSDLGQLAEDLLNNLIGLPDYYDDGFEVNTVDDSVIEELLKGYGVKEDINLEDKICLTWVSYKTNLLVVDKDLKEIEKRFKGFGEFEVGETSDFDQYPEIKKRILEEEREKKIAKIKKLQETLV